MTATDLGLPFLGGLDGIPITTEKQTAKDYASDQEVRWCPGCGDYAVLAAVRAFLPQLGVRRENVVFVSGIGCSSRFPYYMNTYGVHSIHGRAPTIATGLAVTRPDLSVFVVTGDGDALSIGGNHLIHAIRRNVNLTILLFNNRIYGLTKGQYSPTSETGKITKSTPMGSVDHPFNPLSLVLGAEATFAARAIDANRAQLTRVLTAAVAHRGVSFVEIYQDCPIFNDGAFDVVRRDDEATQRIIELKHGEPIRFGRDGEFGVVRSTDGSALRIAPVAEVGEDALVVHDEHRDDLSSAFALSRLSDQDLSHTVTGIFRNVEAPTYDDGVRAQIRTAQAAKPADLDALLRGRDTWTVA